MSLSGGHHRKVYGIKVEVGSLPRVGAPSGGGLRAGFTRAWSSQEGPGHRAERRETSRQPEAWDPPRGKLQECRDLSQQGQASVAVVTMVATTCERSFCQALCQVVTLVVPLCFSVQFTDGDTEAWRLSRHFWLDERVDEQVKEGANEVAAGA